MFSGIICMHYVPDIFATAYDVNVKDFVFKLNVDQSSCCISVLLVAT